MTCEMMPSYVQCCILGYALDYIDDCKQIKKCAEIINVCERRKKYVYNEKFWWE